MIVDLTMREAEELKALLAQDIEEYFLDKNILSVYDKLVAAIEKGEASAPPSPVSTTS